MSADDQNSAVTIGHITKARIRFHITQQITQTCEVSEIAICMLFMGASPYNIERLSHRSDYCFGVLLVGPGHVEEKQFDLSTYVGNSLLYVQ